MNIYHYDNNGIYQGTTVARQDPLDKDRHLVPRKATTVAPPAEESGKARVFSGTTWGQREDHRGKFVYNEDNRSGVMITTLGPVPNRFTLNAPTSELDRLVNGEWVRDEAAELVKAAAQARRAAIESAKDSADLKQYTVSQATEWITSTLTDAPNTHAGVKQAVGQILIRMLPYIIPND